MNRMRTALSLLLALSSAPPVRAQDVDDASRREYYYEAVTEPFYAKDGSSGLYVPRRKYAEYAAPFAVVKSSGTLRVFVVGGSITAYATRWPKPVAYAAGLLGLRFDDLAADLAAALGRPVELINCGMPGYDSYREALVVDEVLGYSPDLILLFSGHNEGIASPPAAAVMLKLQAFLRRSRGYRDLQSRLQAVLGREQAPAESAAARDAAFERNVRDMLDEAKARGVRVGVVAPPLNYRDAPTDDAAPMRDPAFLRGWLAYLRRDDAAAVRAWSAALGAGPARPDAERSLTEFYLARALEGAKAGRPRPTFVMRTRWRTTRTPSGAARRGASGFCAGRPRPEGPRSSIWTARSSAPPRRSCPAWSASTTRSTGSPRRTRWRPARSSRPFFPRARTGRRPPSAASDGTAPCGPRATPST